MSTGKSSRQESASRPRLVTALANVALLVTSFCFVFAVFEVGVRLAGFEPRQVTLESRLFWVHDPVLGWSHRPLQEGLMEKEDFRVNVRINSKGLRDREHPYAKPKDVYRILLLADSFGWGFGVEQEEMFADLIERELEHGKVEVINASVSGYGTDQELLWLEREGIKYDPDLILVLFVGNDVLLNRTDFAYAIYYKPYFEFDAEGVLRVSNLPIKPPSLMARTIMQIRTRSALGELSIVSIRTYGLYDRVRSLVAGSPRARLERSPAPAAEDINRDPYQLTGLLLERIRDVGREHGAGFILFVSDAYWSEPLVGDYSELLARFEARGLEPIHVEGWSGYDVRSMTFAHDAHWNAAGHRFVASHMLKVLEDQQLLPSGS